MRHSLHFDATDPNRIFFVQKPHDSGLRNVLDEKLCGRVVVIADAVRFFTVAYTSVTSWMLSSSSSDGADGV